MITGNGKFYVYAHINTVNGKIYIGISKRDNPNKRWKNGKGYTYNHHFNSAIQKYGWDNFDHEIIASKLTEKEASNMEALLIEKLDATNYNKGYNLADGGYRNRSLSGELNPFYSKTPSKAIEASVKARTGKHLTKEHIEKIRQGNIKAGKNENSIKALRMYDHKKVMPSGSANHKSQSVLCIETNIIYESQRIAEHTLGLPRGSIYQALKYGICAGKYHWKRVLNSNDQSKDVGSSESKWRDTESV